MLETINLRFEFRDEDLETGEILTDEILHGIDLKIEKGSFVTVLGHNGSGKSTLAKHFNAILTPSSGDVLVGGLNTRDAKNVFDIRKRCGMVFQNPDNQIVAAIVEDEVAFAPENLGIDPKIIRERVDTSLKAVEMYDYINAETSKLSGGQKQRIAIAGVLAMEPECIVLDEPTAMLDPRGRREVISTIKRLNKTKNMTVVLITHYMDEAVQSDRTVVIDDGKVVLDGTPKEVFSHIETLDKIGLDIPQVTRLMYKLRQDGFDVPECITVDEAKQAILNILGKRK